MIIVTKISEVKDAMMFILRPNRIFGRGVGGEGLVDGRNFANYNFCTLI